MKSNEDWELKYKTMMRAKRRGKHLIVGRLVDALRERGEKIKVLEKDVLYNKYVMDGVLLAADLMRRKITELEQKIEQKVQ